MSSKTRAVLTAGVLAVALGLGVTAQASARAPRTVSGNPADNITRISDFYGAYIDAESDLDGSGNLPTALRAYYIAPTYLKKLAAWENREHADGVLRAQNTPLKWKVTETGTGTYTEAVITLTWSRNTSTKLVVDMTRDTHKIVNIGTKGLGGK
ncbi:hypothetical protein [Streptomyces fuscichromogenes]|uniref:Uncharacterized protein n=1 Tax=Streptomyces fuscichromogenes TaxID=1324013 RepID=A0A917XJH6_9ACTN|nr:hypothetical protein [Streptomyces fuscichromogenes]GGN32460.1 hypothetical protein GCM10011578_071140 [Streptomyces fuscichromogenes]